MNEFSVVLFNVPLDTRTHKTGGVTNCLSVIVLCFTFFAVTVTVHFIIFYVFYRVHEWIPFYYY